MVNAMNVVVVMANTSNAGLIIRQQKLSLLSPRSKKGGSGQNHRPLFNEDKKCKTWLDDGTNCPKIKPFVDQAFLRSKSGPSAFHLRFLLPQVNSPALFTPTSEIKDVFRVKNRPFLVRKKKALIGWNQKSAKGASRSGCMF